MPAIEFQVTGGHYEARSPLVNNQQCVNLFMDVDPDSDKKAALYSCPGLVEWTTITGNPYQVRAIEEIEDGVLLAVVGDTIYLINRYTSTTTITNTLSTVEGRIIIAANWANDPIIDTYAVILDIEGEALYYIERGTTTLTTISLPAGVTPSSLAYQAGYWLVSHKNSDNYYSSAVNNPASWNASWYKSAEYKGDSIIRLYSFGDQVVMFGTRTIEQHYNSGSGDVVFVRTQGAQIESGIAGVNAVTSTPSAIYWLDELGIPRTGKGEILPHLQIAYQMDKFTTISDCFMFNFTKDGHTFVVFTFPTENKTYVYDEVTQQWHARSSEDTTSRWLVNCYAKFAGTHLVGDSRQTGKIFELSNDTFTEDGETMIALRTCPAISSGREYIRHNSLELHIQAGEGLITGQGSDPMIMMSYSDDYGRTWSYELSRSMGKIGEYNYRTVWNRLGRAIDRMYRFKISDPIPRVIVGGFINGRYR